MNKQAGQRNIKPLLAVWEKSVAKKNELHGRKILFFLGLFSFLVLPFSFIPGAMDPVYHLRFFLWSFLTLCLWVSARCEKRHEAISFSMANHSIFWIKGCLLIVGAVSLIGSVNPAEGLFAWLNLFIAVAFLLICSIFLYSHPNGAVILSRWAVIASIGLAILGLAGRYWNPDVVSGVFFKGIMVNKNLFASSLFLLIPFVVFCLVSAPPKWSRAAILLLPILSINLLLSGSRAVWLALFFSVVPVAFLAFCSPFKGGEKENIASFFSKKKRALASAILILFTASFFLYPSFKKGESVKLRLNLWDRTVQMIWDNPSFGVGLGQWRLILSKYSISPEIYGSEDFVEILAQRPHNDFLWVTSETGVLGGACYLAFFFMLFYYGFKVVVSRADPEEKKKVLSMVYGISGYFILSLFSYPRERPLHSLLIMLMASVIVSSYHRVCSVKKVGVGRGIKVLKYTIVLLLLTSCLLSLFRLYSEIHLKKALLAREKKEWHQVIAHIDKVFLSVYSIDPFGVPLPWYSGMAHYNNKNLPMAAKEFSRALAFHPYHDYSRNNLAVVKTMKKEKLSIGDSPEK